VFERVVFIVGAGHSVSAGGPTTAELTTAIIDGDEACVDRTSWPPDQIAVLAKVRDHIRSESGREPTYESIFTWLWTAHFANDETMYRGAWNAADAFEQIGLTRTQYEQAAYDALRLIEDGVAQALDDKRLDVAHVPQMILQAAEDNDCVGRLTLISPNHDRLLERSLQGRGYTFCDGFAPTDLGTGIWDVRSDARARDERIQLIKLHGSVDWWSPRGWGDGRIVYRAPTRPASCAVLPLLLIGTGPKLFQSSTLIFARQILDAGRELAEATCVVIVGYSFGDVRLNSLWEGALMESGDVPTLIVNRSSRNQLRDAVATMKRTGPLQTLLAPSCKRVIAIEESADKVSWEDCRAALRKAASQ
jgi:hypothetical protein